MSNRELTADVQEITELTRRLAEQMREVEKRLNYLLEVTQNHEAHLSKIIVRFGLDIPVCRHCGRRMNSRSKRCGMCGKEQ